MSNLYSERANERRRQFNAIINRIDMVLMNNITDVDENIYYSFEGKSPVGNDECEFDEKTDEGVWLCNVHGHGVESEDEPYECEGYETDDEVYQWFAINNSDADFLKKHDQYVAYSEVLDTYFLAITHFGTGWDYVDSMVSAFDDCYHGLDEFTDEEQKQ